MNGQVMVTILTVALIMSQLFFGSAPANHHLFAMGQSNLLGLLGQLSQLFRFNSQSHQLYQSQTTDKQNSTSSGGDSFSSNNSNNDNTIFQFFNPKRLSLSPNQGGSKAEEGGGTGSGGGTGGGGGGSGGGSGEGGSSGGGGGSGGGSGSGSDSSDSSVRCGNTNKGAGNRDISVLEENWRAKQNTEVSFEVSYDHETAIDLLKTMFLEWEENRVSKDDVAEIRFDHAKALLNVQRPVWQNGELKEKELVTRDFKHLDPLVVTLFPYEIKEFNYKLVKWLLKNARDDTFADARKTLQGKGGTYFSVARHGDTPGYATLAPQPGQSGNDAWRAWLQGRKDLDSEISHQPGCPEEKKTITHKVSGGIHKHGRSGQFATGAHLYDQKIHFESINEGLDPQYSQENVNTLIIFFAKDKDGHIIHTIPTHSVNPNLEVSKIVRRPTEVCVDNISSAIFQQSWNDFFNDSSWPNFLHNPYRPVIAFNPPYRLEIILFYGDGPEEKVKKESCGDS